MKAELSNCKKCGKVYPKTHSEHCNDCRLNEEDQLKKLKDYISNVKEGEKFSLNDLSEGTGVSTKDIQVYMKKRRLLDVGSNMILNCKICKVEINAMSSSLLCSKCDNEVNNIIVDQEQKAEKEKGPLLKSDKDHPSGKPKKYGLGSYDF